MATAEQLREIRRKAGIGEFAKGSSSLTTTPKSSAKAPRTRRNVRRVSRQPTLEGRFNPSAPAWVDMS